MNSSEPSTRGLVPLAPGATAPLDAVRFQHSRSSGPGGQNVNKVNTRVEMWVHVGSIVGLNAQAKARLRSLAGSRLTRSDEIHIAVEAGRSQQANRQQTMERLRELIILAKVEPKVRKRTRPGKAARERRLASKRLRSDTKQRRREVADE